MSSKGIKISDGKEILEVKLNDILDQLPNGAQYYWSILFLDGMPYPNLAQSIVKYEDSIHKSKDGILIEWSDLLQLQNKYSQIYEATILGSANKSNLHHYDDENTMQDSCDFVINLIDCSFWEVYSKDQKLIDRLKNKFKEVKFI